MDQEQLKSKAIETLTVLYYGFFFVFGMGLLVYLVLYAMFGEVFLWLVN